MAQGELEPVLPPETAMLQSRTLLGKALGVGPAQTWWNFVYSLAIVPQEGHKKGGYLVRQQSGILESLTR